MKPSQTLSSVIFATMLIGSMVSTAFAEVGVSVSNRGSDDGITVYSRRADSPGGWRKLGTVRGQEHGNWTLFRPGTYEFLIQDINGQRRPPTDRIYIKDGDIVRIRANGDYNVRPINQ